MADDDDPTRFTVRLPSETAEQLRSELPHFTTEAARFQFLAQFYLDYKESNALPAKVIHDPHSENEDDSTEFVDETTDK